MAHQHSHNHDEDNLKLAFFLNFSFAIAEVIGGFFTNSIAIIADALHDIGDSVTLALSWRLEKLSKKEGDEKYSYGYKRYSLLSALIGGLILVFGSGIVMLEAIKRIQNPQQTNAKGMLIFAFAGIAINGYAALKAGRGKNMNSKMVFWHLLEDALGWAVVLMVSIIMLINEKMVILDPIISLVLAGFVLINVSRNMKKTINLFLQGVPDSVEIAQIEKGILEMDKVNDVHHTHIWSLDGEHHVLTTHIVLCLDSKKEDIRNIKHFIRGLTNEYDLAHTTIEFEYLDEDCSMGVVNKE
jgi:cobalt-zinc-cadmium efflux system protein